MLDLKVDKKELLKALQMFRPIIGKESLKPVLSYIKLSVENDGATLFATNYETDLSIKMGCGDASKGVTLLPFKQAVDAVKSFPNGSVSISKVDGVVSLSSGSSSVEFNTPETNLYPMNKPEKKIAFAFSISSESLVEALSITRGPLICLVVRLPHMV